jgi:CheY-like chemotaxis protein
VTSPLPVLTVLVVDDQAPFRFAVKAVLRRLPCFQLAGEAKSGPEAITLVDEVHPALVLMDINMPEMNGIEATRRIVAAHPDVVVFLCSTHDVTDLPPGAPTSGARAYINKEHFGADALRQLWHNRDSTPFARLLPRLSPRTPRPRPRLTCTIRLSHITPIQPKRRQCHFGVAVTTPKWHPCRSSQRRRGACLGRPADLRRPGGWCR